MLLDWGWRDCRVGFHSFYEEIKEKNNCKIGISLRVKNLFVFRVDALLPYLLSKNSWTLYAVSSVQGVIAAISCADLVAIFAIEPKQSWRSILTNIQWCDDDLN